MFADLSNVDTGLLRLGISILLAIAHQLLLCHQLVFLIRCDYLFVVTVVSFLVANINLEVNNACLRLGFYS